MAQALPQFSQFEQAAAKANLIGLCVPIAFDHETAVTLADRFVGESHLFLLESATAGPGSLARYSFLGFDPLWIWQWHAADGAQAFFKDHEGTRKLPLPDGNPILGLREVMSRFEMKAIYPKGVRLAGPDVAEFLGATGYLGYDVAAALEPTIGVMPPKTLGLPDAHFFVPRTFLVLDHLSKRLFVTRSVYTGAAEAGELKALFDAELKKLTALLKQLAAVHSPPPLETVDRPLDYAACTASFAKPHFLTAAERCLEEIRAGEVFQIQIGNRLSLATDARPFDIFRHLRTLNPSPYMFFYKSNEHHILGASPEIMVNVTGRQVTHRPIAGTRKKTWELLKDQRMRKELIESEKERAEHVMLVDLSRNDIGRIAAAGTVEVEELMSVEEYSHVFHMVSQVSGQLASGKDAFDAMVSSFPNGTVSGAPKIRAMQLINAIEPVSREFYAGSLGMFDFKGNLKSTLLIRTLHAADGVASTQASAGIVYDSIPEEEWLETTNKMAACLTAMQNTR